MEGFLSCRGWRAWANGTAELGSSGETVREGEDGVLPSAIPARTGR